MLHAADAVGVGVQLLQQSVVSHSHSSNCMNFGHGYCENSSALIFRKQEWKELINHLLHK
jgi:hypothetical protein